jgi:flagellar biogenesis protein FliO
MQASLLVGNYIRVARIENFYNFMIVPQEEIDLIKKQKNRRDLVIFLCSIALIGLIGYLIYRLVKRNRAAKIVVS